MTPSFASENKPEAPVSPLPQPEKKRFAPPVLEEKEISRSASESPKEAAKAPVKEIKNRFQQKILEAQRAQAESFQREFNPPVQEKIVPVDAENIIHAPLDDFAQYPVDYSDEEERLALQKKGEDTFHNLFDAGIIPEEEQEALDWQAFLAYCEEQGFPVEYVPLMQGLHVVLTKKNCYVKVSSGPQATIFNKFKNQLENLLCTFLERMVNIQLTIVAYELVSDEKLREKASNNLQIQMLMKEFGAEIYRCYDIKHDRKN